MTLADGLAKALPPSSSAAAAAAAPVDFSCLPESSSHDTDPDQCPSALRERAFDSWEPTGRPQCDLSQEFRHTGWHHDRIRVYWALLKCNKGTNRLKAFCLCGTNAMVQKAKKGEEQYKITACRCHDRFCVPCSKERSYKVKAKLLPALGRKQVRMITLTLKSQPGQKLAELVKNLADSFRQLRRLKLWTDAVDGEAHFLEVTRGRDGDHWHVHYHVLAVGRYIEVGWLSQAWKAITRGSAVVHVTLARTVGGVASYVGKYASKGFDAATLKEPALLEEAILALQSVRLWDATGTLRKAMREAEELDYLRADEWEPLCSLADLYFAAVCGDEEARQIITWLHVKDPTTGDPPPWSTMEDSP